MNDTCERYQPRFIPFPLSKGVNIIIDGQFGSTGKGLLADVIGYQYSQGHWAGNPVHLIATNAAPNAGHTFYGTDGKKRVAFHLPASAHHLTSAAIYMCAGSIVDLELLAREIRDLGYQGRDMYIHPRAAVLQPHHADVEKRGQTKHLASTMKGVGACLAEKVARLPGTKLAVDFQKELLEMGVVVATMDVSHYASRGPVIMEVPQGLGLSLNHGLAYPFCTSRDLTISSALNDLGVHPKFLGKVFASYRTYPIRVGNVVENGKEVGFSGPFYGDSIETTWEALGQVPERTTVTQRIRRVASFSFEQFEYSLRMLRPDVVFINFMNYFTSDVQKEAFLGGLQQTINHYHPDQNPAIWLGYGPNLHDVVFHSHGATK